MKKIIALIAVALVCSTTVNAQILKGLFGGKSSSKTTHVSQAQQQGQTTGAALRAVYNQYLADGKKFVAQNNIMSLLSLSTSLEGIKSAEKNTAYYKDFATGLVKGSSGLVQETTQDKVIGGLQTLASQINSQDLQKAAAALAASSVAGSSATGSSASTVAGSSASSATGSSASFSQLSAILGDTSEAASTVTSLLSLFKK